MPITTNLDKFRLELGDHPTVEVPEDDYVYLFNDAEANYFIANNPTSILGAVADACDSLASRFAREMDFSEDGQNFRASQLHAHYAGLGAALRQRARRGGSVRVVSLVTPYSEEDEVAV